MDPKTFLESKLENFSLLIDECHRDLLVESAAELIKKIRGAAQLIATTGTPLTQNQLLFLQRKFNGTALLFKDPYKHNCIRDVNNIYFSIQS